MCMNRKQLHCGNYGETFVEENQRLKKQLKECGDMMVEQLERINYLEEELNKIKKESNN